MLIATNANYIFDQLTDLLDQLSDDQYTATPEIFSGASVGKHYRHIIEFFQAVSLADQTETICYDNRLRDVRIENSRMLAKELLQDLKNDLAQIDNEKRLTLIGDLASNESSENAFMITSLYREFHYAVEHAIHHMAIIKMGVRQTFPEVNVSREFGIAPSTLRYEHASAK
jgi:uncharacterized damage-inducible protein DinB